MGHTSHLIVGRVSDAPTLVEDGASYLEVYADIVLSLDKSLWYIDDGAKAWHSEIFPAVYYTPRVTPEIEVDPPDAEVDVDHTAITKDRDGHRLRAMPLVTALPIIDRLVEEGYSRPEVLAAKAYLHALSAMSSRDRTVVVHFGG